MWLLLAVACTPDSERAKPAATPADTADTDAPDTEDTADTGCGLLLERTWYRDADGDGYGDDREREQGCGAAPHGWSYNGLDCDDDDAAVNPEAREDCATTADDDCASGWNEVDADNCVEWHRDADGDGAGSAATTCACAEIDDYTATADDDCDDTDPAYAAVCPIDLVADGRPVADARGLLAFGGSTCTTLTPHHGDATGDGGTDLVLTCADDRVLFVAADGSGAADIEAGAAGALALSWPERFAAAGDLTGDGVLDLLVTAERAEYDWGSGTLVGEVTVSRIPGPVAPRTTTEATDLQDTSGTDTYAAVAGVLGDIDGDGIGDAAYSPGSWCCGAVRFFPQGASAGLAEEVVAPNSMVSMRSAGDTNGDGLSDLLNEDIGTTTIVESPFDVYRGWTAADAWIVATAPRAVGDLDGDGYDDVYANDGTSGYLFRGPFAGTGSAWPADIAWAELHGALVPAYAELDGDDGGELLLGDPGADRGGVGDTGAVYVVLAPAAGALERGAADRVWYGAAGEALGSAITPLPDLDGDGADDVAVAGTTGVWLLGAP